MNRIQELAEKLEGLRSEILELEAIEGEPTEEQAARMEAILPEWDEVKAQHDDLVERAEKIEKVRQAALNPNNVTRAVAPAVIVRDDPFDGIENVARMSAGEQRDRAMRAFADVKHRGVSDDQIEALVERIEMIPGAAAHALAHGSSAYRGAFAEWLQTQGQPLYSGEQVEAVRTALSLTAANGGYTLPTLLDPTLIHTGTASKNPIRQLATVVSGTQNVWNGVTVGNVTSYWTAEATALTDGNSTFAPVAITASKITAYLPGSFEIFEDSNLQASLPALIAESFDYLESDAFVVGSGSGAPTGVVTALTTSSTVAATTGGTFTTGSAVDVFALLNAIPSRFEDNATWLANKATFNLIKQMSTGSNGSYFWTDFNNAVGSPLLGSPVAKSSAMTSTVTTGSVLIVLGDFSRYVIYDRIGTQVEFDPMVVNTNGLPTGQRALIAHKRVGGNVVDTNAFRRLKL